MNKELLKMQLANTCDGINRATRERAALIYKLNISLSLSPTGELLIPAGLCENINEKLEEVDGRLKALGKGYQEIKKQLKELEEA